MRRRLTYSWSTCEGDKIKKEEIRTVHTKTSEPCSSNAQRCHPGKENVGSPIAESLSRGRKLAQLVPHHLVRHADWHMRFTVVHKEFQTKKAIIGWFQRGESR